MKNDIRDEKQDQILEKYISGNLQKASIVSATGTGKSFIALKIIKRLEPKKVLILVNSTVLRDDNWKAEFIKFGLEDFYTKNVVMQTYQYMYKQKSDPYNLSEKDLIIMDEIDFIANTDKLANVIELYKNNRVLGLTGYITPDKQDWFKEHLPVIEQYTANDAQEDGLLNQIKFVFIKYDLSKNPKDIKTEYKKGNTLKYFYQSENSAYDFAQKKFAKLIAQKAMAKRSFELGEITYAELKAKLNHLDYKLRYAINARSNLLLNSVAGAELSKNLIQYIKKTDPNHKIIVFSKRNEQSKKITNNIYNGSIGKKKAQRIFDNFLSGKINVLGVCDKLDRGVNIPNLNHGIFESFYGSDTKATQRFGRLLRLQPNEFATVYIFLPYYMAKKKDDTYECKPTQQVMWAAKMLISTVVKHKEVWDYRAVKT